MHLDFHIDEDGNLTFRGRLLGHESALVIASGDVLNDYLDPAMYPVDAGQVALAPEPGADIAFHARGSMYGIERKTFQDLVGSRWTGRLADELRRMLRYYDAVFLCIESEALAPNDLDDDWAFEHIQSKGTDLLVDWLPDHLQTCLLDWQLLGVCVLFTASPLHTMAYARKLHKKFRTRQATEPLRPLKQPRGSGFEGLTWIPKIGPATAARLVEAHGSVAAVLRYYLDTPFEEVPDATGQRIWRALHSGQLAA